MLSSCFTRAFYILLRRPPILRRFFGATNNDRRPRNPQYTHSASQGDLGRQSLEYIW